MSDKKINLPLVALRGMVLLPGMVAHFDVSREKSIRAIEKAMQAECFYSILPLCFKKTSSPFCVSIF